MHVTPGTKYGQPNGLGREVPVYNTPTPNPPGATRAITQVTSNGSHAFRGAVSHDRSRLPKTPGENDHFEMRPVLPHRQVQTTNMARLEHQAMREPGQFNGKRHYGRNWTYGL